MSGNARPKEPKERAHSRMPSTSPARRYALEMWVKVEVSLGVYANSYSIDFAVDTLNQPYPGCTRVHLSEVGHLLAFYGKKVVLNAGLTVEQGMKACRILQEIPRWMGSITHLKVWAIRIRIASMTETAGKGEPVKG